MPLIDIETGDYEIDRDEIAASDRLFARRPDAQVWFRQVGSRYARRFGPRFVKNRATSPRSQSDWDRVDRMKDEEIDLSDLPEIPPEAFARAIVRKGLQPVAHKAQITLRVGPHA
jgi:hypothetical protein